MLVGEGLERVFFLVSSPHVAYVCAAICTEMCLSKFRRRQLSFLYSNTLAHHLTTCILYLAMFQLVGLDESKDQEAQLFERRIRGALGMKSDWLQAAAYTAVKVRVHDLRKVLYLSTVIKITSMCVTLSCLSSLRALQNISIPAR